MLSDFALVRSMDSNKLTIVFPHSPYAKWQEKYSWMYQWSRSSSDSQHSFLDLHWLCTQRTRDDEGCGRRGRELHAFLHGKTQQTIWTTAISTTILLRSFKREFHLRLKSILKGTINHTWRCDLQSFDEFREGIFGSWCGNHAEDIGWDTASIWRTITHRRGRLCSAKRFHSRDPEHRTRVDVASIHDWKLREAHQGSLVRHWHCFGVHGLQKIRKGLLIKKSNEELLQIDRLMWYLPEGKWAIWLSWFHRWVFAG